MGNQPKAISLCPQISPNDRLSSKQWADFSKGQISHLTIVYEAKFSNNSK